MPAAKSKADLLEVFDKELAKLRKTLAGVDETCAGRSVPGDGTSIKGILAHRTHWIAMFHKWYADGANGREVHVPAEGYKWSQLKEYNAGLYADGDRTDWDVLLTRFEAACTDLRTFIETSSETDLYTPGRYGWTGKWTLGRYAEASGPSHFRSANAYIRKALRSDP